jgi:CheY-like chemotaxis protein
MDPYTIVLADDHAMFREGVRKIIERIQDLSITGEASDGLELLELLKKSCPNLVILDISMPNLRGLEAIREIKRTYPKVKIIVLTMHKKKEFIRQALKDGATERRCRRRADSGGANGQKWRQVPLPAAFHHPDEIGFGGRECRDLDEARNRSPKINGGRQKNQRNRRNFVYQSLYRAPPPLQYHGKT